MKSLKFIASLLLFFFIATACEDEEAQKRNFPGWNSGVHGLGQVASGSASNFLFQDPSVDLDITLRWISLDKMAEVETIEVYVNFFESYIDQEGNPKIVAHGGSDGVLLASFTGSEVPANREDLTFNISQEDIYNTFAGATFDYDGDGNETPVFNNPAKPERTETDRFIPGDNFAIRWEFVTKDGRRFDSWSPSVCTELPGANCSVSWTVTCETVIKDPPGDYVIQMNDSYGDGWNDAAIRVIVDGVATDYTLESGASGSTTVSVPEGTQTLTFEFVSGDWDSEVTFTITSPKGNVIAKGGPSPAEGELTLDLCKE